METELESKAWFVVLLVLGIFNFRIVGMIAQWCCTSLALPRSSCLVRSSPCRASAAGSLRGTVGPAGSWSQPGFVAALSGLWMTQFYALPEHDGIRLYGFRLLFVRSWLVGS